MTDPLDPRLTAFRADLADARLQGRVEAERFVDGLTMRVTAPLADMMRAPQDGTDHGGGLDTQILYGHDVAVFETDDGWCWCQSLADGYVGYVRSDALGLAKDAPTHYVTAPRTFVYSRPDLKSPRSHALSMGSRLVVRDNQTVRGTDYAVLESGEAVIARHIASLGALQADPVTVAETLLRTPYLWGGNSAFGIDCSGLVQLTMACCGHTVLRDSDMQASSIGTSLEGGMDGLQRGDLVFWRGHVGMMRDSGMLIHANAHTMDVALEPLADAVDRIGYLYGQPTGFRRPEPGRASITQ